MDFIEVLLILVFIVIPLVEGVLKQRRSKRSPESKPEPRSQPSEPVGAGASSRSGGGVATSDDGPAADMVPSDLWEVLTGERRPVPAPPPEPAWDSEAWLEEEETLLEEAGSPLEREEIESPWDSGRWDVSRTEGEVTEPVSLEYVGPEAISLEQPPPPPEVRHRLYHEKYDPVPLPSGRRASARTRELRSGLRGPGLRRSILLAEILGPPKGLA